MQSTEALAEKRRFHRLGVARIVEETDSARSIVLDVPASLRAAFAYEAGQFVTLEVEVEGAKLRRCYSLASSPVSADAPKVTVKRVRGGRVSNWLNDRLHEGDTLSVLPPEGRFVLRGGDAPLALFAGGSGITPVISILKTALAMTSRSVRLLYANRDARSVIFARELEALARQHAERFEVLHRRDDTHGLVDAGTVRAALTTPESDCYLCGPSPFMTTVEAALSEAGVAPERIRVEKFVSASDAPTHLAPVAAEGESPAVVAVTLEGKRHLVPYTPGKSILRAALDAGIAVPYSCEEGFCGCCVAQLREGSVTMAADDALTKEEKARGLVLTCQATPRTRECAVEYLDGV